MEIESANAKIGKDTGPQEILVGRYNYIDSSEIE
jgi:hypothetical protein